MSGGVNALNDQYVQDPRTGAVSKKPGLLSQFGIQGGLTGLYDRYIKGQGGTPTGSTTAPTTSDAGAYNPDTGMTDYIGADGNPVSIDASGNYYDERGELIWSPSWNEESSYEFEDTDSGGYYDDYTGDYVAPDYNFNDD
jgi:hypothetical protein